MKLRLITLLTLSIAVYLGCGSEQTSDKVKAYGEYDWLSGTEDERWNMVAHQFHGFSATMVEVQYRFQELYWAGIDENWEYALHQIEHIEEAVEAGIERRPKRAESAQSFLIQDVPAMEAAIERRDKTAFMEGFEAFRISCNACHAKEEMSFVYVKTPTQRLTTIGLPE